MGSETESRSAAIFVLGCKVNQAEAAGIKQLVGDAGYRQSGVAESPDLIVVNTCCVTSKAEGKSRRLVNRLRRLHPGSIILVTGCLAEIRPSSFDESDGRLLVYGRSDMAKLKHALTRRVMPPPCSETEGGVGEFVDFGVPAIPNKAREFIKIQDGCASCCSYCIVPRARGPERSLDAFTVVAHVEKMAKAGVAEIVLSGVNLGAYGKDLRPPVNLEWLIKNIMRRVERVRFRLSSLEPEHITSGIVQLLTDHDRLCKHLHVPLQSGDDKILSLMNRSYDSSFIRSLVKNTLDGIPDACIGFDVIVGFPGETDEAFNHTVKIVQDCNASYLHVFPFSARPETLAAKLPCKVPDSVLRERVQILRDLSSHLRRKFFQRCLGRVYSAVLESDPHPETGQVLVRTDNYIPVYCPSTEQLLKDKRGIVKLVALKNGRVLGEAL